MHIEGKPFDRGYQHGTLLASEIAGYIRCFAAQKARRTRPERGNIRAD